MRGPAVLAGPLTPSGPPLLRSASEVFDDLVVAAVHRLEERWSDELGLLEFAVEETPILPDDGAGGRAADRTDVTVPLAALVRGRGGTPTRVVLFRRPLELRAESRAELDALVRTVLAEQLAELLGRPPEEIDPGYEID